jgi:CYTH domain-containing protein
MGTKLEKERRFVVKPPSSWTDLSEIFDDLVEIRRITQVYLTPKDSDPAARIRKSVEGLVDETSVRYDFNQKEFVEAGVHKEKEYEISKEKYEKLLKDAIKTKVPVEKTRFVFKYNDQLFELDVFKGHLRGLAILEIELDSMKTLVELPPFLKVLKEVTEDKKYSNFHLANKKSND